MQIENPTWISVSQFLNTSAHAKGDQGTKPLLGENKGFTTVCKCNAQKSRQKMELIIQHLCRLCCEGVLMKAAASNTCHVQLLFKFNCPHYQGWPEPFIDMYIRCIYGILSREATIQTVKYGVIYGSGQPFSV